MECLDGAALFPEHKMGCFCCYEEDKIYKTADNGGPDMVKNSAGSCITICFMSSVIRDLTRFYHFSFFAFV